MRLISTSTLLLAFHLAGTLIQHGSARSTDLSQSSQSSSGLLINPPGFAPLPTLGEIQQIPRIQQQGDEGPLNLTNIQGDVLVGMRKNQELFFFFGINSVADFKAKLASDIYPRITTTTQMIDTINPPTTAVNIAFSNSGLQTLGITDLTSSSDPFVLGQAAAAPTLGDPSPISKNWVETFTTNATHGVFLIASNATADINTELANITAILGNSICELYRLQGEARPGSEMGHEHFGFLDGISQPGVAGFTANPEPGQDVIRTGIILIGEDGDSGHAAWAKDGTFLAFRQLKQLVPEFNKFLLDNAVFAPGVNTTAEGAELLGARMMGRWKSGAPIELTPFKDNVTLGSNASLNNNFDFTGATDNSLCPFSAHIRKTNPRSDIPEQFVDPHRMIRAGIPYGPEVSPAEASSNTTSTERGLAFVAYQSNIADGFQFVQSQWSNAPSFLNHSGFPLPGFDPIIGANQGQSRDAVGLDPANQTRSITLVNDFVVSRGGEYFFTPSLSAIRDKLSV